VLTRPIRVFFTVKPRRARRRRPRLAFTLNYNVGVFACDADDCTPAEAPWKLHVVERGDELVPDDIFLRGYNCSFAAWFLHRPSIALTADGLPRVAYQAMDISGGSTSCPAGVDMTWSRLARLGPLPTE
jgi:hypothetical protein